MQDFSHYRLGAIPSPASPKHYRLASATPATELVDEISFESEMGPITDQGPEGSCVGHAVKALMDFHEKRAGRNVALSARDIYAGGRLLVYVAADGCVPSAALDYGRNVGYAWDSDRPYVAKQTLSLLGPEGERHRRENRVASYAFLATDPRSIRAAMQENNMPVLAMINVDEGFYVPLPSGTVMRKGRIQGAHEIVIVGYSKSRRAFRVRNSWSTAYGDRGYAWLPEDYGLIEAQIVRPLFTSSPPPWWPPSWWPWR